MINMFQVLSFSTNGSVQATYWIVFFSDDVAFLRSNAWFFSLSFVTPSSEWEHRAVSDPRCVNLPLIAQCSVRFLFAEGSWCEVPSR